MMREGEVFVHILPQNTPPPAGGASLAADPAAAPARPAAPAARTSAPAPKPTHPSNARH
jgi:cell division protein FtsB